MLSIHEHRSSSYASRTEHNVNAADLTVAFAVDFETPGERLTRRLAGLRYIALPLSLPPEEAAAKLLRHAKGLAVNTLNVAGNGLETLTDSRWTQEAANAWVHAVLSTVHKAFPLGRIVSGGQTGIDLAAAAAGVALGVPSEMTLPLGFRQRGADGADQNHTYAEIERQVYDAARQAIPADAPRWAKVHKWVDLSAIGVYMGYFEDGQKNFGLSIVDVDDRFGEKITAMGFSRTKGSYGDGIYLRTDVSVTGAMLHEAFGNDVKWVVGKVAAFEKLFQEQVQKKAKMNARAFFAQEHSLGVNHLGEEVFEAPSGRFVFRNDGSGKGDICREGLGRDVAEFLRVRDRAGLAKVAYGFVSRIVHRKEQLRREDVKALIAASNEGEFSPRDYQEFIEAAINRLFTEEIAKQGKVGLGAFNVANKIYMGMPELGERTANSVANQQYSTPVPMSALAQALLVSSGSLKGASVLEPTIGNASLVSMLQEADVFGVEIDDERIARLPEHVLQCVQGDATLVNFRAVFGKPEGFDFAIANPPFGKLDEAVDVMLPSGSLRESMSIRRLDHLIILQALHARKSNGRAVFITGADSAFKEGEIKGRSHSVLNYLYDHYEVDGVVDVAGELYKKQGAAFPLRLYVIGKRRDVPYESDQVPEQLPIIRTYEGLRGWAEKVLAGEPIVELDGVEVKAKVKRLVDDGPYADSVMDHLKKPSVDEADPLLPVTSAEPVDDAREDNEFQHRYLAFSKVAEPTTMIPANLSGPIYEALASIQETHGDIDTYVGTCLRFSFEELQRYFSPEQVDALAMVFHAHDRDLGFLLADKMGVGKGRVLAAVARREHFEGRIPTFVTVGANLFTDFLERDLADIGSRDLFKRPFLVNDGTATLDASGDIAVKAIKRPEFRKYAEQAELPEGTDMVMLTYSQISRKASSHLTSRFLGNLAEKYPLSLLLDESHMGAGASNTSENLEYMIDCIGDRGRVVYSSGTPIKGAKNLRLYKRILPQGINHDELLAAVQADPLSLQEALNYEIASQGCLVCRELDDAGINRDFIPSEDVERNRLVADQMSEILTSMSYLSGDVKRMVTRLNKDFEKELANIPDADREGARMGASSMNFGSRLHQINRQFLLALKARDVVRLALTALEDNRKPIITVQHTGESLLTDFVTRASEQYLDGESRATKVAGSVVLDKPVGFKDLMHKYLERIQQIKVQGRYGDVTTRRVETEEMEIVVKRIAGLIDVLPEDLPLTSIDYVREALGAKGYVVGEISGRGLQAVSLENGSVAIEPVIGRGDKTRIVKTARAFNNGDVDVLVITEAGSTGLSVHASAAVGRDVRPRRMIKWEMQADITKERQIDGRANRTGQVCKPDYQIPMTGLPADDRQAMMFNNKNRNLTASTVANRDSREIIRDVPDLLNVVGDRVAEELLYDKPDIARHLDIELPEDLSDEWRKPPLFWINKLTGRISLLRVVEQEALYEELQSRFREKLDKLKVEGLNPLEVQCHTWGARLVSRERYMGAVAEGKKISSFSDAVYLATVEYQEEMRAVRADGIDRKIAFNVDALRPLGIKCAEDVHFKHVQKLIENTRGAILQKNLGRRFTSIAAALADKNPNEVKNVNAKIDWLLRNLGALGYGTVYYDNDLDGKRSPRVIVGVTAPSSPEAYLRLSDWRVNVMKPGVETAEPVTLSMLYSKDTEFQRWRFKDNPPIRQLFDQAENGIVTRRARLLDGNLFEAVTVNLRTRLGSKVVYTDESGSRQHGILVHSHISDRKLWDIPERVRDADVLTEVLRMGAPITDDAGGECFGKEARNAVVLLRNQAGSCEIRVSPTKSHGAFVFADPVLSRIKGKESECRFYLEFAEFNGKMCSSVQEGCVNSLIAYLIAKKNIDFYVKDRQTLDKARGYGHVRDCDAKRDTTASCSAIG